MTFIGPLDLNRWLPYHHVSKLRLFQLLSKFGGARS